ncbi:MAG: hypothetical protein CML73_02400 [Rhodobiaceae bacterium]|nr:hypothetical protein [Rhodobiaceae bacterium]
MMTVEECESQIRLLQRAIHYCTHALPSSQVDLMADPTDSYPGASGYACQTMKSIVCSLESNMSLSK